MSQIDSTHDPASTSWVASAQDPASDFPIQNLPWCVFDGPQGPAIGVGIGDQIVDVARLAAAGRAPGAATQVLQLPHLNGVMGLSSAQRRELRHWLSQGLSTANSGDRGPWEAALVDQASVTLRMPCQIGDYTDFYASVFHATNVGSMFRPTNPLLPNYKHIPIGYHGRASSVVPSGTPVRRPVGQLAPEEEGGNPTRDACRLLDYELEVGFLVAQGNDLGTTIPIESAEAHLFGLTLLNDWSARDLQKWEYQPLGPFLAKSFATTISPWIVTLEALAPFRCPAFQRPEGDPQPLPYLQSESNQQAGGIEVHLEVWLQSQAMQQQNLPPVRLSESNLSDLYWTPAQMLTHHASNGCNLRSGDLLGSGTVSGRQRQQRGCLLELTWDGELDAPVPGSQRTPLELPTGETRKFLADGDTVTITGYCQRPGHVRIGFGKCQGQILPASV